MLRPFGGVCTRTMPVWYSTKPGIWPDGVSDLTIPISWISRCRSPDLGSQTDHLDLVMTRPLVCMDSRLSIHPHVPCYAPLGVCALAPCLCGSRPTSWTLQIGVQSGSQYGPKWVDLGSKRDTPKWGGPGDDVDGPPGSTCTGFLKLRPLGSVGMGSRWHARGHEV